MGNWVDFTFYFKPRVVDEEFFTILDECFAAGGYVPFSITSGGHFPPVNRLEKFLHPTHKLPVAFGYALPGHQGEPPFYADMSRYEPCITHLRIDSILQKYYFEISDWEPGMTSAQCQEVLDRMSFAEAGLKIFSALHERTVSFHSKICDDYDLIKTAGATTEHEFAMDDSEYLERMYRFYETVAGQWLCPVCFHECGTTPPWSPINDPTKSFATGSPLPCPTCGIRFGIDDADFGIGILNKPSPSKLWSELRKSWFTKAG